MSTTQERKFVPTCRYEHGELEKLALRTAENEPRGMFLPTFKEVPGFGAAFVDGNGFTVASYRCKVCGYIELFDDEVGGD